MHGKVEVMLRNFLNLVPSLQLCLTEVSNWFWRDDEETQKASDEDIDTVAHHIQHRQLLHTITHHCSMGYTTHDADPSSKLR